jgi:hypothetical protein
VEANRKRAIFETILDRAIDDHARQVAYSSPDHHLMVPRPVPHAEHHQDELPTSNPATPRVHHLIAKGMRATHVNGAVQGVD